MTRFVRPFGGALLLAAALAGCGDPETTDDRGYTKAPLEKPFPIVDGQERTIMDEMGEPNRIEPEILEAPAPAVTGG